MERVTLLLFKCVYALEKNNYGKTDVLCIFLNAFTSHYCGCVRLILDPAIPLDSSAVLMQTLGSSGDGLRHWGSATHRKNPAFSSQLPA